MASHHAVEFIADAYHEGKQQQLQGHTHQGVEDPGIEFRRNGPQDYGGHREHQNRHDDDHKQEAGAAAGMEPGLLADVFHRQGQLSLIAANGLMLSPMVGEYSFHILHAGDQEHIDQEDHNTQNALQKIARQFIARHPALNELAQQGRQQNEQRHGKQDAHDHRQGDDHALSLFRGELFFQPGVKLRLFFLRSLVLVGGVDIRRVHQGGNAGLHGGAEAENAADKGNLLYGEFFGRFPGFDLGLDALLVAHHRGALVRAHHHDPFDQRLTADHGFEFFVGFFLCHSIPFSSPVLRYCASMGSRMVTRMPPPSALDSSREPLCMDTISSHTARPMPLPRALEDPL